MWPLTSRTLKPTLDQSIVLTGGGGKAAMFVIMNHGVKLLSRGYAIDFSNS